MFKNIKTAEQLAFEAEAATKRSRETELKKLLDSTDHKVFPDYEPKEGEDLEAIKASRSGWRSEIRSIQAWLAALRDVTQQEGFPESVEWPPCP